jgi:hypothetical protein
VVGIFLEEARTAVEDFVETVPPEEDSHFMALFCSCCREWFDNERVSVDCDCDCDGVDDCVDSDEDADEDDKDSDPSICANKPSPYPPFKT